MNLKSRIEPLEITLSELDPDIVVLTEHNMSSFELERFNLDNYNLVSQYSRATTSGGGVVILSKAGLIGKHINSKTIDELCEEKLFECCVAKFNVQNLNFLLVGIYRKPQFNNKEFFNRLNTLIEFISTKGKYFILAGDFNVDLLKNSKESKELKSILIRHGMNAMVDFPTRVTAMSESCLDNFLTNINKNELKISGIITSLSDHDGQILDFLKYQSKICKQFTKTVRNFSQDNMNLFKSLLDKEDWLPVFSSPVSQKYNCFDGIFRYYFDSCFPIVTKKINKNTKNT